MLCYHEKYKLNIYTDLFGYHPTVPGTGSAVLANLKIYTDLITHCLRRMISKLFLLDNFFLI